MSKKILVVLDPGHKPKYNKGAAPGYYEGDKMYDFSEFERDALEAYGIDVIITRKRENDMSLWDRGQAAVKNANGYDVVIFISNHSNAFNGNAYGVVVYRSLYLPESATLGQKLIDAIVGVMKPVTEITYSRGVTTRKGNNGDYYGVIRGSVSGAKSEAQAAKGPVKYSYIVEHGFHDNAIECAFLNVSDNLKKMAEAEAKVIADYFGLSASSGSSEEKTETVKPETPDVLYRVQVGAYSVRANADAQLAKVKKAGFNTYMVKVDGLYKIQVGAYSVKANADNMLSKVKAAGFDAFITTKSGEAVAEETTVKKSIDEIAREVIDGKWGNGTARKEALTKAGYDYATVQAKVNELVNGQTAVKKKTVDEIAREVIKGVWGNGADRKKRLTAAGYDYSAVQRRVNELLR